MSLKGNCNYYPFEYVRSAGMIQRRFNITSRINEDGDKVYDYEYEDFPDDGTISEDMIGQEPSISGDAEYQQFIAEREYVAKEEE